MNLADEMATIGVLWKRDLLRFVRQRSRLFGALLQPIIFWLMIGGGLSSTFQLSGDTGLGYMEYFFPGISVMMLLFASIFGTITVIEDRHEGFLQSVLVGPGSRASVVTGKSLGVGSVGLIQVALFLCFTPIAGFALGQVQWLPLIAFLVIGTLGLSAFGFALAWWIDSSQGYHAVMSIILLPAWVMSGAMFPVSDKYAILDTVMRVNPMSYLVSGVRRAMYGGIAPDGTTVGATMMVDFGVVAGCTVGAIALATWLCYRRP